MCFFLFSLKIPFDLMKKKKKKKKTGFDLDAALNEDGAADGSPSQATENKAEETPASADLEGNINIWLWLGL